MHNSVLNLFQKWRTCLLFEAANRGLFRLRADVAVVFEHLAADVSRKRAELGESLIASELYEIANSADVDIPGLREPDEDKGKLLIGSIMGQLFKTGDCLTLDEFTVARDKTETERHFGGGTYIAKLYQFKRGAQ